MEKEKMFESFSLNDRTILVQFIYNLVFKVSNSSETDSKSWGHVSSSAVVMLDHILHLKHHQKLDNDFFQSFFHLHLIAACCCFLADKVISLENSVCGLKEYCESFISFFPEKNLSLQNTIDVMRRMEICVILALDWQLQIESPFQILHSLFTSNYNSNYNHSTQFNTARYLIKIFSFDPRSVSFSPFEIAKTGFDIAMKYVNETQCYFYLKNYSSCALLNNQVFLSPLTNLSTTTKECEDVDMKKVFEMQAARIFFAVDEAKMYEDKISPLTLYHRKLSRAHCQPFTKFSRDKVNNWNEANFPMLTQGGYGKIIEVNNNVWKVIKNEPSNKGIPVHLIKEISNQVLIGSHKNIISYNFLIFNEQSDKWAIAIEKLNHTLFDYMRMPNPNPTTPAVFKKKLLDGQLLTIMKDILVAIKYLHSFNICHMDLSGGNVMIRLDGTNQFQAVLIDFGVSKQMNHLVTTCTNFINYNYRPIEFWEFPSQAHMTLEMCKAKDIWCIGILFLQLYFQDFIFLNLINDVSNSVSNYEKNFDYLKSSVQNSVNKMTLNSEAQKLASALLNFDYKKRISAEQGLEFAYFQ